MCSAVHSSTVAIATLVGRSVSLRSLTGAEPVDPLFLAFHVARDLQGKAIDGQVRLKAGRADVPSVELHCHSNPSV